MADVGADKRAEEGAARDLLPSRLTGGSNSIAPSLYEGLWRTRRWRERAGGHD